MKFALVPEPHGRWRWVLRSEGVAIASSTASLENQQLAYASVKADSVVQSFCCVDPQRLRLLARSGQPLTEALKFSDSGAVGCGLAASPPGQRTTVMKERIELCGLVVDSVRAQFETATADIHCRIVG